MATLYVVATPIGNLEDLGPRAARVLAESPVVAAESVERTRKLLAHLGLKGKRLISCRESNRRQAAAKVLDALGQGQDVALVSDAGTPGLNDPGEAVVASVAALGYNICPVAGPSALAAALSVAGFKQAPLSFLGFPPAKAGARRRLLSQAAATGWSLALFEGPHRLEATAQDLAELMGGRQVVVCRELTKLHEQVVRATCAELPRRLEGLEIRGEFTLVIGPGEPEGPDAGEVERLIDEGLAAGDKKPSALAKQVAAATGLNRDEVYRRILERRKADASEEEDDSMSPSRAPEPEPRERELLVANSLGLHARAAAKITETVSRFEAEVVLSKGSEEADAASVLSILGLDAPKGSRVMARASGPQAGEALKALDELFADLFGEGR
ncbi:MAG: 16S rRNA (cytidine(1402)-2'-O)-methyltransferase [Desulfarculaceae bacterium]|nr:16S rRNA (cytidine(1402)-2'-O)-methyltransferase [Desulfarculaceae bacterium]MCF8073337.1 16S rRNA (cytidine(1402)-2'-O)-methyltransferase [Desulfarculaceae bacterium]MCF8103227.1 16S rRNA (cytidine(1402)-2'-O)-methyltransferase [Desulfarculaceae bacterium]MCF8116611.1 16S rRNA (cytidine(1402)-2'-O)-methyltransferase [Desulfarculaceae bacterium]